MLSTLQAHVKEPNMSLELDCTHINRALKLYKRMSLEQCSPILHPITRMNRRHILTITEDNIESKQLLACAHDIVDIGWALFTCIDGIFCVSICQC